jgi:hypothetical protein
MVLQLSSILPRRPLQFKLMVRIRNKQIGHAVLTVNETDHYLITLPRLRIDGLWYGSPYIELVDSTYIVGGGYTSVIDYKGKGWLLLRQEPSVQGDDDSAPWDGRKLYRPSSCSILKQQWWWRMVLVFEERVVDFVGCFEGVRD